ncbi:putative carotenoid oxygenase [Helianthus annuus]|nr:putative carotenoid oxygenase [Helianthus annuus]
MSNTNVFEHGGKHYSTAENYIPQEIDLISLETYGNWNPGRTWSRPLTSHPKVFSYNDDTHFLMLHHLKFI